MSSGYCDFEMDMCGWVNTRVNDSSDDWSWSSGTSAGSYAPKVDHTTNTALGKYQHITQWNQNYFRIFYYDYVNLKVIYKLECYKTKTQFTFRIYMHSMHIYSHFFSFLTFANMDKQCWLHHSALQLLFRFFVNQMLSTIWTRIWSIVYTFIPVTYLIISCLMCYIHSLIFLPALSDLSLY